MGSWFLYGSNKLHFGGRLEIIRMILVLEVINEGIDHFPSTLG